MTVEKQSCFVEDGFLKPTTGIPLKMALFGS